jgi:S-adenosylmethionine decarboxylase
VYSAGISYLIELYGCPPELLDDEGFVETTIQAAVEHAQATLLQQSTRRFHPQGVTAFALLAESHIAIHTWPELRYAAIDVFTCGQRAMPERAYQFLVMALQAGRHTLQRVDRGTGLGRDALKAVPKSPAAAETVPV